MFSHALVSSVSLTDGAQLEARRQGCPIDVSYTSQPSQAQIRV